MQEGIVSLMQMAKTSAAIKTSLPGRASLHICADRPDYRWRYSKLCHAWRYILAEPGSLIGFAGPRVIEQTIGQKLPEASRDRNFFWNMDFSTEFVERGSMRDVLSLNLKLHDTRKCYGEFPQETSARSFDTFGKKKKQKKQKNLTAWDRVQIARSSDRPSAAEYIDAIFLMISWNFMVTEVSETTMPSSAALLHWTGQPVTVIGIRKGHTTKENIRCNFGMPSPEGYKKGSSTDETGREIRTCSHCICRHSGGILWTGSRRTGTGRSHCKESSGNVRFEGAGSSVVIGEGGSGGALALAVGNEVWMMENATYTSFHRKALHPFSGKTAERHRKLRRS